MCQLETYHTLTLILTSFYKHTLMTQFREGKPFYLFEFIVMCMALNRHENAVHFQRYQ